MSRGINKAHTKVVTSAVLDAFQKANSIEGNYQYAELAKLYSIKEDSNYQATWCLLNNTSSLGNILIHDVIRVVPANKMPYLPLNRNFTEYAACPRIGHTLSSKSEHGPSRLTR